MRAFYQVTVYRDGRWFGRLDAERHTKRVAEAWQARWQGWADANKAWRQAAGRPLYTYKVEAHSGPFPCLPFSCENARRQN